ncbi:type III secretion system export apparatus subunit SctT [Brevundimonas sp. 3P9-tot-E]|uniref:type III secretion system export apparatus subunit SctT n=1 Tax=Brevundimonas TaxID=41275 RepID=UPI00190532CC|nr:MULTISPECIES: type III secretion system export apparatus subunit SctT [Brevundimonas]MDA0742786.1 type III secretion system export apparatus subunit SctT [Pseudomonadota bacterium]MBK1969678.1 type III secretion system export apparatus subunit SctT [Brevundimonas diminuta]MBK1976596.1 type III secretion system export apparatus subunit SctT [Brevundimonas diminuta]MDA1322933.1 type III secretion system export apparatus subunit SctT [Pseudomonadota bacterium]MDM8353598.1 type III secretion sy
MFEGLDSLFDNAILVAVSTTRVATTFLLMPLLSPQTVPAMVRNSIFLVFGLAVLTMQPQVAQMTLPTAQWILLFGKEALVGVVIGFFFATMLWAFEAAGQIIDTKVGATMAQVVDPLSGHQTSLNGEFLGRLANFVFMFSGGLLLLVGTILDSFVIWPIGSLTPVLTMSSLSLFEGEFTRLMTLAVLFASPVLVVLFVTDGALGLVNRYAPQLNVFSLSLSIKAWLATLIILIMMTGLVQTLLNEIMGRHDTVLEVLKAMGRRSG